MPRFTPRQLALMKIHGVAAHDVLDARAMTRPERVEAFSSEKYLAAVRGRALCGNKTKQHTSDFWTTGDHCVECYPQNIQHQKKYRLPGYIYIAASATAGLTKIGISDEDDIATRIASLRSHSYANATDWTLVECYYVEAAGRVERLLIDILKPHHKTIEYLKGGRKQKSKEVFSCKSALAKRALDSLF